MLLETGAIGVLLSKNRVEMGLPDRHGGGIEDDKACLQTRPQLCETEYYTCNAYHATPPSLTIPILLAFFITDLPADWACDVRKATVG